MGWIGVVTTPQRQRLNVLNVHTVLDKQLKTCMPSLVQGRDVQQMVGEVSSFPLGARSHVNFERLESHACRRLTSQMVKGSVDRNLWWFFPHWVTG